MDIRVRATQEGWAGLKFRSVGDDFDIDESQFSSEWMEKTGGEIIAPVPESESPPADGEAKQKPGRPRKELKDVI